MLNSFGTNNNDMKKLRRINAAKTGLFWRNED
jgi:hypothetical protein